MLSSRMHALPKEHAYTLCHLRHKKVAIVSYDHIDTLAWSVRNECTRRVHGANIGLVNVCTKSCRNLAKVWGTSFAGNLVGSACIAYGVSSIFVNPVYAPWLAAIAAKKCSISFPVAVAKGIGANWLVNLGTWHI